jgi:hypothetical protein
VEIIHNITEISQRSKNTKLHSFILVKEKRESDTGVRFSTIAGFEKFRNMNLRNLYHMAERQSQIMHHNYINFPQLTCHFYEKQICYPLNTATFSKFKLY